MTTVMNATRHEPATPAAVEALVRSCSAASLGERFAACRRLDPDVVLDRYLRYLLGGPAPETAVVARVGTRVVGLLNLGLVTPGVVDLGLLVVDDLQRRGVATALVTATLSQPRWRGWSVRATVHPDNRAGLGFLRGSRLGPARLAGTSPGQLTYVIDLPGCRAGGAATDAA